MLENVVFKENLRLTIKSFNLYINMVINPTTDFERMVMDQKSIIYSICYMFTKNQTETDDLFQEVLINLWNGFEKFRGESALQSWVYRVSMNTCISYKRKKKAKTIPLDIIPDIISGESDESRQAKQLRQRIGLLKPVDRALVLLWLENMSYDEIAAIVGISTKAVGVRLVRIKEFLKRSNNT